MKQQTANTRMEAPTSKLQAPKKLEDPTCQSRTRPFGAWCLVLFWSLKLGAWSLLLGVCSLRAAPVPENAPARTTSQAHRWLLIVETSQAMQRRAAGTLEAVNSLLGSGMKGQLRPGDTLGVWTFNDELHTGIFPLQTWAPERHSSIMNGALNFLQGQKYEKSSTLSSLVPGLKQLIKNSDLITIVLVSTGEEKFEGTPFDKQIAEAYAKWLAEEQKRKMPFLTILRAKQGQIIGYSVTPAPWPLEMPALPVDLKPDPIVAASPIPAKTPARPSSAPLAPRAQAQSLIVHGKQGPFDPPATLAPPPKQSEPAFAEASAARPVSQTHGASSEPLAAPALSSAEASAPAQQSTANTQSNANAASAASLGWRITSPAFLWRASLWLIGLGSAVVVLGALTMAMRRAHDSARKTVPLPGEECVPVPAGAITIGPALLSAPRGVHLQTRAR